MTSNQNSNPVIYLIPGQGADYRLFNNLNICKDYETRFIHYFTPDKNVSLTEYAHQLSSQIDTSNPFILIGVSLGGMIATEISQFSNPEKVLLISSAKSRLELPLTYRFQKAFPLYKILTPKLSKWGALVLQPIVERDRGKEKETFVAMLKDKDPNYILRTIEMIMNWERETAPDNIIHIHGDFDRTIPYRNVICDYTVKNGSHLMVLTRGKEISEIVNHILTNEATHFS